MTVLELLSQRLPVKYVMAIIANMEEKRILDHKASHLTKELEEIFNWSESKEGYDFWATVFESVLDGYELPELPFRASWEPNTYISLTIGSFLLNVNNGGNDVLIQIDLRRKPKTLEAKIFKEKHLAFLN